MKKIFAISIILASLLSTAVDAQKSKVSRWEAYAGIGTANAYTDIGGAYIDAESFGLRDFLITSIGPSIALGGKYKINHRMYARVNLAAAILQGRDSSPNYLIELDGGYEYTSPIFEPSAMYEFYFLPEGRSLASNSLHDKKGKNKGFSKFSFYGFVGVGGVLSFPTVRYIETGLEVPADDGNQVLGAEFSRIGLVIPFGLGLRFSLPSNWTINAELGRRYPFTDYIDGYSSKFAASNDAYDFLQFIFSYKI